MTYEEAKDQVAVMYGHADFNDLVIANPKLEMFCRNNAAELYAQSKVKEALEMAAEDVVLASPMDEYNHWIDKQSILNVYDKIFKA